MTTYYIPAHVQARPVQDEIIILDTRTNRYLGLNGTGAVIWSELSGGGTVDGAVNAIVERFDVTPAAAVTDVARLVNELIDLELLGQTTP